MLIDSHCHLDYFSNIDEIINNAQSAGVKYMLNACAARQTFPKIIDIISKYDNVFGAIGQHPHEAENEGIVCIDELLSFISKHKKVIAIGETGLDYSQPVYSKDIQIENLENHIKVAQMTGLPIIIHNRDSNEDMSEILSSSMKTKPFKAIIHCFTGDLKMANLMLDLGFYISASGIITFKNAISLLEVFKYIPNNRILVETDSPYLAPIPFRGKQNEPAFVVNVAKKLAEAKNIDFEELCSITSNNFKQLFNLNLK